MGSPTLLQTILMALFIFFPSLSLFLLFSLLSLSLSLSLSAFFFHFLFSKLYNAYYATFSVLNYCLNVFFLPLNCNK